MVGKIDGANMILEALIVAFFTVAEFIVSGVLSILGIDDAIAAVDFGAFGTFVPFGLINEIVPLPVLVVLLGAKVTISVALYVFELIIWVIDNMPVVGS